MKPNQVLIAVLSATAITGGVFVSTNGQAQACWRTAQQTSTNSVGQFPQSFNSTTPSQSPQPFSRGSAVGIALLGSLLAGGVYLSRRWHQSQLVADEADQLELPSASTHDRAPERELVGGRK